MDVETGESAIDFIGADDTYLRRFNVLGARTRSDDNVFQRN